MFSSTRRAEVFLSAVFMFFVCGIVIGAEPEPSQKEATANAVVGDPLAEFTAVQAKWDQLEKDVRSTVDDFRKASDDDARLQLRTRYARRQATAPTPT